MFHFPTKTILKFNFSLCQLYIVQKAVQQVKDTFPSFINFPLPRTFVLSLLINYSKLIVKTEEMSFQNQTSTSLKCGPV